MTDDAGTVRCSNGALISVSGCATLPVQAAVEGDVTTATKQIDNRIFGTEGSLLFSGLLSLSRSLSLFLSLFLSIYLSLSLSIY